MIEFAVVALIVIPAIVVRAKQRGVDHKAYLIAAIAGFTILVAAGLPFPLTDQESLRGSADKLTLELGAVFLGLRWVWVGGVFFLLEFLSNRGRKAAGTWQCPECRMFNDLRTLRCTCGVEYEGTVATPG